MESQRPFLRWLFMGIAATVLFSVLFFGWVTLQNRESTLAIRPIAQNYKCAGWFFHLASSDANGIHFKSITPLNDTLLIKFESSAQSAAAKEVLDRTLPHGYIVALQDDDNQTSAWLSRLRDTTHRFG